MANGTYSLGNDLRSRKIVYVSSCLLNQNRRFPGIAVTRSGFSDLVSPLLENGIGIEQIPCLECRCWGGVERRTVFRFLSLFYRLGDSKAFSVVKPVAGLWLRRYRHRCRAVARRVVADMRNLIESGCEILAVVGVNDSPTCGVTMTFDLPKFIVGLRNRNEPLEKLQEPELETMGRIIPAALEDGKGIFVAELVRELERARLTVTLVGFNPWLDSRAESARLLNVVLHRGSG